MYCNFSIMNGQFHDKSVYYRAGSSKGGSVIKVQHVEKIFQKECLGKTSDMSKFKKKCALDILKK
ncbi:unnamed protein product [Medioppia subpectinata]|uniref:Uncharacterized protein n=1 Tax=Medioppia subpectinata TaxID=1979941 RepID=A0A7R9KD04_9ACAR|nr:unnamed protein product [Medioppia subpectinata]CAG2100970.1 unnamed protein product [Medioppia subpectinata]